MNKQWKAFDKVIKSDVAAFIKEELTEGRGIRLDVKNQEIIKDIHNLIEIKLGN